MGKGSNKEREAKKAAGERLLGTGRVLGIGPFTNQPLYCFHV